MSSGRGIIGVLNIKIFRVRPAEYLAILPTGRTLKVSGAIAVNTDYPRLSARGRHSADAAREEELEDIYDRCPEKCPYCHGQRFRRYGYVGSNRRRRYQCLGCGHTFSGSVGTVYYRGRLDQREVRLLADMLVSDTTVIGSAKAAGVSRNTAMRYRRLLLGLAEKADRKPVLSGKDVQVDETYRTLYGMIGKERKLRGISHQKEAVCIGTDASGALFLRDLGPGHPDTAALSEAWRGKVGKGSTVTHDGLRGYRTVFDGAEPKEEVVVRSQIPEEEKRLDHVNHLCSGVQWFLEKHRGIRKKNLESYLSWYELLYNADPSAERFEEMVLGNQLQKRQIQEINT